MKIHIIDPGLLGKAGHHYDINLRVATELMRRRHDVRVYSHQQFAPSSDHLAWDGIEVVPLFSHFPYAETTGAVPGDPGAGELHYFEQAALRFAAELKEVSLADIWLCPTLFAYQLFALSRIDAVPAVFGVIQDAPDARLRQGRTLWRRALREAPAKSGRIELGVLEPELLLEYEQLLARGSQTIHQWPIPYDGVPASRCRSELLTVGILGHQRDAKGLQAVGKLVNGLIRRGYRVILNDSSERLQVDTRDSDRLRVLGHVPILGTLIQECDLVLLNYDPEVYRFSGSGIAWEALACGVPVLAPVGTTMSRLVRDYGAGATFCTHDPASMYEQLDAMRADYAKQARRAQQAAEAFKAAHGTAKLVDRVLALTARWAN